MMRRILLLLVACLISTPALAQRGGVTITPSLFVDGSGTARGTLFINQQSSNPSTTTEGAVYYNTTAHEFRVYNGTAWVAIGSVTGGTCTASVVTAISSSGVPTCTTNPTVSGALTASTLTASNGYIYGGTSTRISDGGVGIFQLTNLAGTAGVNADVSTDATIWFKTRAAVDTAIVQANIFNPTTGYQIGGAAATGVILRGNGTNYVATTATYPATVATGNVLVASATNVISAATPASLVSTFPANQTGNATATLKMNGLGAAAAPCLITPVTSGRVGFNISGQIVQSTTADGVAFKMTYGTTTPPANSAAAEGTVLTPLMTHTALTGALEETFSVTGVATGLSKVATWFDLQVAEVSGGTASITNVTCSAWEF